MRKCRKCGEKKELTEFQYVATRDRHTYRCLPCLREDWKDTYQRRKKRVKKKRKETYCPKMGRDANLRSKYGISLEEYEIMLDEQNGVCKICKKTDTYKHVLAVDHCHETGKIRGLLCGNCNTGLGKFKDNITYLLDAIKYLKDNGE